MIHVDRKTGRGGGVALYIHSSYEFKLRTDIEIDNVESIFIEINMKFDKNIIVGTLYRPPGNSIPNFLKILTKY